MSKALEQDMKSQEKKIWLRIVIGVILLILCVCAGIYFTLRPIRSQKVYTAQELGITVITSETDYDGDGVDDYTDILLGARAYVETRPPYKSKYYEGGYPTDKYGVCTDVVWNAFFAAGYSLKDLVDADIAAHPEAYPEIQEPDPNIDFRRVRNLKIFFERNAEVLTTDLSQPEEWQAGDIVVFSGHIAICSDKRNAQGMPFIIHHGPDGAREKNEIQNYTVIGHYRWN